MGDIIDKANDASEIFLRSALSKREDEPVATGKCLNCDHPLGPTLRWCDAECRDDWQKRQPKKVQQFEDDYAKFIE